MANIGNYKGQHKPWKDEEKLREAYGNGNSERDLAERWGCTRKTISYWREKFGIESHDLSDYARDHMRFYTSPRGYEAWQSTARGENDWYRVHRLLAVAEFGAEDVKDMEVHHKNGIPWDNRSENLELTEKAAHAKIHHEQRERDEMERYR